MTNYTIELVCKENTKSIIWDHFGLRKGSGGWGIDNGDII